MSLRSFLASGHQVWLWTYGDVGTVPFGVVVRDGNEILPASRIFKYRDHDTFAGFSNNFRYSVLFEHGGTWSDSDVVCLRPLPEGDYLIPSEDQPEDQPTFPMIRANCVLRGPSGGEFLRRLRDRALTVPPAELKWAQTGPFLVTAVTAELGLPWLHPRAFCPVPFFQWPTLLSGEPAVSGAAHAALEGASGIHLWHEMQRRGGKTVADAEPGSLIESLLRRFGH